MKHTKQYRQFYLGATRSASGKNHPSLRDVQHTPELSTNSGNKMNFETWKAIWGKGPLFRTTYSTADMQQCFNHYARSKTDEEQTANLFAPFRKYHLKSQKEYLSKRHENAMSNEILYEKIFNENDSWEGRSGLNWNALSDDTLIRVFLSEIFGSPTNRPSPSTTEPLEIFVQNLIDNMKKTGTSPVVEKKNLEFWTEAVYFSLVKSQEKHLENIPQELIQSLREYVNEYKTATDSSTLQTTNPFRQIFTNFFIVPNSKVQQNVPLTNLENAKEMIETLKKSKKLIVWYKGTFVPEYQNDKNYYLAQLREEIAMRKKMLESMVVRGMIEKNEVSVVEKQIKSMEDAKERISKNEDAWKKVLSNKNKPMKSELVHFLNSIPQKENPNSPYVHNSTNDDRNHEVKSLIKTFQHTLSTILCKPLYKKCLLIATKEDESNLRSLIYENAWLTVKISSHDIYSKQRAEMNDLIQVNRRKLELCIAKIQKDHADVFFEESVMANREDLLFAPDSYSTSLENVVVNRKVVPFLSGGFPDLSPGVRD